VSPIDFTLTAKVTDSVTLASSSATGVFTVNSVAHTNILFGVNQNHYADLAPQVAPIKIQRSFKSLSNGWPAMPVGQVAHWSINPSYTDLMAGKLDSQIITELKKAPPGSLLTAWHEPELHSGLSSGPTMPQMADINHYMLALVHKTTPNVKYGPVITAHADAGWCVAGMDFYGVDTYDWKGFATQPNELQTWSDRMPPGPRVVAETNTFVQSKRPAWFDGVYQWLKANGGIAMQTFWNPGGSLSGPWIPTDTATIDTLNTIAADAAGL
jgi:hypothetical protein